MTSDCDISAPESDTGFGVYVHIPFCAKRCDYCAFATWTDRFHLVERYVDAVVTELQVATSNGLPAATSVFFGGGTPSIIPGASLAKILTAIPRTAGAEVTVECNPDTVTAELFDTYVAAGVNRISLGVQSMVPRVLEALGRTHNPDNVIRGVQLARAAGLENWNLDLIYGSVGEDLDDWRATLEAAVLLQPPHVSAYGLTVEPGTPLADDPSRYPDDDNQAACYEIADEVLGAAGLANYEISNWARPGHECRHNLLYWAQGDYLGVGCAAHSHRAGRRFWNVRTPERYLALIEAGESAEGGAELLDDDVRRIEGLQLALRTRDGVPDSALDAEGLEGLVTTDGVRVRLTRAGRLVANELSLRLR
jgi:oxygen-independent coproporphyrinogen-3 oxidase